MTRGRAWIGVLSVLLAGIVALNVASLSIGASSSKIAGETQALQQENSALRARLAEGLSNAKVAQTAAYLGMASPDARQVNYLNASADQVKLATARWRGIFGSGSSSFVSTAVAAPTTTAVSATTTAPTTTSGPTTSAGSTVSAPAPTPAPAPAAPTTAAAPTATVAPSSGGSGGVASG
jgi:ABC-type multidrug transport system fused ATPase/permease subunit